MLTTYTAKLIRTDEHSENLPGSWFISHQLGGPAKNTYTEVTFPEIGTFPEIPGVFAGEVRRVLNEVTRAVAVDLYGSKWAFHYAPERYASAIAKYGLTRRERVAVTDIRLISED